MNLTFKSCLFDEQTGNLCLKSRRPDVFLVFDIPYAYSYDVELLEKRYLELSRLTHPDHQMISDEASKQRVIQISAWVNQSYKDLKDSLFRAEFLLNLIESNNGCCTDPKKLPGTFLLEMLDLQEELEERSVKEDENRLEEIVDQAEQSRKKTLKKVGNELDTFLSFDAVDQESMQKLRDELNTIRYHDRIISTAEELLDKL